LRPFSTEKELMRKMATDFLVEPVAVGQGALVLN